MSDTFEEAVKSIIDYELHSLFTAMPCSVVSCDPIKGRLDVKPLLNAYYTDGTIKERAMLLGVPLQMPASGASVVNIPVKQGDIVLCVFSMRGLDAFKSGDGTPQAPTDFRMFDKRDAIAIPGIFPFNMHPNLKRVLPFNPDALSLTHNIGTPLEATVELSDTGVKTQMGASILNVTPIGVDITGVLTINGVPYVAHTHSGVTTGPGVSGPVVI